jgi:membrane protein
MPPEPPRPSAPERGLLRRAWSVARETVQDAVEDELLDEAAKMAFYFFLSLFPLVLTVFALTGMIGGDDTFTRIGGIVARVVPGYAWEFVSRLIVEITERDRPGMLSFGILLTLWAASNGIAALTTALNDIYQVAERRPWWRRRLLALGVLLVGVLLLVMGAAALVASVHWLRAIGLGPVWDVARWPLGFLLPAGAAWLSYRYLPARDQRHAGRHALVGALVATLIWSTATILFRVYVASFSNYARSYGAVGAVIVLLLWFQLSALAILLGGELAHVLERRQRLRDGPGEVPPDGVAG